VLLHQKHVMHLEVAIAWTWLSGLDVNEI
jgi:hypothetical protein